MAQFDAGTLAIVKRLQNARLSLLQKHPFYALLLMYMKFSIDLTCETAYTDGNRIAFNPEFMQNLSDSELEFVLMHEVLHTALGHQQENFEALLNAIVRAKPAAAKGQYIRTCSVASTMGPGVKINPARLGGN